MNDYLDDAKNCKLEFYDLFKFSHGRNQNKQGGCVTLMWLASVILVL